MQERKDPLRIVIGFLRGLIAALFCFVLIADLWLLAQKLVFHKELPDLLGYSPLVVLSGSMDPVLQAGDVVIIHSQEEYQMGEVVTFRTPTGSMVTHRIVGTTGGQFITRGDANNTEDDELLSPEQIVGAAVGRVPGMGYVLEFLRTPLGILVLLAAGIVIFELPSWIGTLRQKGRRYAP